MWGAELKSNGFFFLLQMCEDEERGMDVLSPGGGRHSLATKSGICRGVSGAAAEPRGLSGCFHHTGREGGREERAPHNLQAALFKS